MVLENKHIKNKQHKQGIESLNVWQHPQGTANTFNCNVLQYQTVFLQWHQWHQWNDRPRNGRSQGTMTYQYRYKKVSESLHTYLYYKLLSFLMPGYNHFFFFFFFYIFLNPYPSGYLQIYIVFRHYAIYCPLYRLFWTFCLNICCL